MSVKTKKPNPNADRYYFSHFINFQRTQKEMFVKISNFLLNIWLK